MINIRSMEVEQILTPKLPLDVVKDNEKPGVWKREEEEILRDWADKAMCYRWMHDRSHQKYRVKYALFTIPVIVLSTLTGTANFAQERFPAEWKNTAVMAVGGLNIMAGIISTISQFLKISELNEGHRVASIAWGKFSRNLRVELARHPKDRTPVRQLTKTSREEFDRLMETSPSIPDDVVSAFNSEVVRRLEKKNRDVKLPEICGDLQETTVFHPDTESDDDNDSNQINWTQLRMIERLKEEFMQMNGRDPTEEELAEIVRNSVGRGSTVSVEHGGFNLRTSIETNEANDDFV